MCNSPHHHISSLPLQLFPDIVPQQMALRAERRMQSGAAADGLAGLAALEMQHRTHGGAAEQHTQEHSFGALRLGAQQPQAVAATGGSTLTTSLCTLAVVGCIAAVLALPLMFARVTNAPA